MSAQLHAILATLRSATTANPIRREVAIEAKVLDEKAGLVRYVASDETLDAYNEIVRVNGWRFTHFAKNAPFVNSHDYCDVRNLLGQVVDWQIVGGQLVEDVKYALTPGGDTLADWCFAMVRDKFLRAVSVGFVPTRYATKWDADKNPLLAQIAELKLDAAAAAKLAVVYMEQEQIELSQCVIGANPNALARSLQNIAAAYKAGTIGESAVEKLSAAIAASKNAAPADFSADAGAAPPRTKLAIMAVIQAHL